MKGTEYCEIRVLLRFLQLCCSDPMMNAVIHRVVPKIDSHLNKVPKTTTPLLRLNLAMLWEQSS
jgi:hypothetical protein